MSPILTEGQILTKEIVMSSIDRADIDRRSAADRRRIYDLDYFQNGGIERRKGKERRAQAERRNGWIRISNWASVNIQDLKFEQLVD